MENLSSVDLLSKQKSYPKMRPSKLLVIISETPIHPTDLMKLCRQWYVMDPWFHRSVEEFNPFVTHVKDQRVTQEEVFESKTCSDSTKVEQVFVLTVLV